MKRFQSFIILILAVAMLLTSCTDANAKIDETNKFLLEDYSQFILPSDQINETLLSNYNNIVSFSEAEQNAINKYKNKKLIIGVPVDNHYTSKIDNEYLGTSYYSALQLEKDLGLDFEFVFATPDKIVENLDAFDIVANKSSSSLQLLFEKPYSYTENYLSDPYMSVPYAVYSKNVNVSSINIYAVLPGKTGILYPRMDSQHLKDGNIKSQAYPNLKQDSNINELMNENLDFLIVPETTDIERYGYKEIPFSNYPYETLSSFLLVKSKFDQDFVDAVNKTINATKEENLTKYSERLELLKLSKGYFFTDEEKEFIDTTDVIKTKYMSSMYPYSFYDFSNKLYNGKLVSLLSRVSAVTGLEFVNVSTSNFTTSSELIANTYNGDIDLAVGVEDVLDRRHYMKFSNNLFNDDQIFIGYKDIIKDNSDVYALRVGTISNTYMDVYLSDYYTSKDFFKYDTVEAGYQALVSGDIDALATTKSTYYYLVNSYNDYKLKNIFYSGYHADARFGTPRTKDGLLLMSIIDKVSSRVDINEIVNANYPLSEIDTVGSYRTMLYMRMLVLLLLAIVFVSIYSYDKVRKVKKRNINFRALNKKLNAAFKVANFGILTSKIDSDFFVLSESIIDLLGIHDEDTFAQDSDKCIFYRDLIDNYLVFTETDTTQFNYLLSAIKDPQHTEFISQVKVKYARNENNILYFDTITTLEDKVSDNIIVIMKDATKDALFEQYEKSIENSDALTEAKNRATAYKMDLKKYFGKTVAYIGLDNFSQVNNTYGHRKGDDTLSQIVQILNKYEHTTDVYRMNGDEFYITLDQFSDEIANDVLTLLKQKISFNNYDITLSASIGFFTIPDDKSLTTDEIVNITNYAMLQAKNDGKDRFVVVDEKMLEDFRQTNMLDSLLKRAIIDGDIIPYFQPYYNNLTDKIVGYETLMRWRTDDGILSPFLFLSIAIKSGDIYDIDLLMFKHSALFLKELQDAGLADKDFVVSSNFTPITLIQVDPVSLVEIVKEIGVSPSNMTIEITEQLFASDKAFEHVRVLKQFGFNIALDDFSVGHSSMSYLKRLSVDVLKIDKSLLDDTNNKTNLEIFKTVVNLGKSLNAKIISEGVETSEMVKVLKEANVHIGQGYYYARPADKEKIYDYIKEING